MNDVPPIVVFGPLPPVPNGIADYIAEQLTELVRHRRVVVVIDDGQPTPLLRSTARCTILRRAEYDRQAGGLMAAPHLYHLGNNPDHLYSLDMLRRRPGVVLQHDGNLHYLAELATGERWGGAAYRHAILDEHGRLGAALADTAGSGGWKDHVPMSGTILDSARGAILHSAWAAERVRARRPDMPVAVVPHHLSPAVFDHPRSVRTERRREVGLPADALVLTAPGFIARAKQVTAILAALTRIRDRLPPFKLVLAGMVKDYDPAPEIAAAGLADRAEITGYLDERRFMAHLCAADIILNLRWPIVGETSGTLTRSLGMGKCIVTTAAGPFGELPDGCAVKIPHSERFVDDLAEALLRLGTDPGLRGRYESAAADHGRSAHDLRRVVPLILDLVDRAEAVGVPAAAPRQTVRWRLPAAGRPAAAPADLAGTAALWHAAAWPDLDPTRRWLVWSDHPGAGTALHGLVGGAAARIRVVADAAGEPAGGADCLLVHRPVSALAADPVGALLPAVAALAVGGEGILALWSEPGAPAPWVASPLLGPAADGSLRMWGELIDALGGEVLEAIDAIPGADPSGTLLPEIAVRFRRRTRQVDRWPLPWYRAIRSVAVLAGPGARDPGLMPIEVAP